MALEHYYAALQRLLEGNTINIAKGTYKINKNTVSIEAGRKAGSIKKSRPEFKELINKINMAAKIFNTNEVSKEKKASSKAKGYKTSRDDYKSKYLMAINREAMLVKRLQELEEKINTLESEKKVVYIQKTK